VHFLQCLDAMQRGSIAALALIGALLTAAACGTTDDDRLAEQPAPDPEFAGLPDVPQSVSEACDDFCTAVGDACNSHCYRGCIESYDFYDTCHEQQLSYIACVRDNFVNCTTVPAQCGGAEFELSACKGCRDGGLGALDGGGSCSCVAQAAGATAEVHCAPNDLDELECLCIVDDMELLTCVEQDPANACRAVGGCCGGLI
jgi:hypothetical protein